MLSRALSPATVTLLICCFAAIPVQAQNLEAGKSPSQIFAGTCSACHKSPRGLLKTVPAGSLPGFLRQHYTTSSDMASLLSAFLISNGATDTRYVGTQPRQDKDAKSEARPINALEQLDRHGRRLRPAVPVPPQEAAKPDAPQPQQAEDGDELPPQAEPARRGRNAKRLARQGEAPGAAKPAVDGQIPAQAASERGPDGRKSAAKQRLSKRGKLGDELPKTDAAKTDGASTDPAKSDAAKDEPSRGEPVKDDKPQNETAKYEGRPEGTNPPGEGGKVPSEAGSSPGEGKPEAAKIEAAKQSGSGETPALRADPVPPVTPAPPTSPMAPTAASSGTPELGTGASASAVPSAPPPAVTASAPSAAPVPPAGPPAPPISQ
jgi:hypothetical protein